MLKKAPWPVIPILVRIPLYLEIYTGICSDIVLRPAVKISMDKNGYEEFAGKIPLETGVAFEVSGSAHAVSNALKNTGYMNITVAHPGELSWIIKSKKNIDKMDSLKLAKLHPVGMIPESHLLD